MKSLLITLLLLTSVNAIAEEKTHELNADFFNQQLQNPKLKNYMYMYASGVISTVLMYEKECDGLEINPTEEWMLEKWNTGVKYFLDEKQYVVYLLTYT